MAILKEYHKPTSVPEALALLARTDVNLVPLAGGTRLVGALETRTAPGVDGVVDLGGLPLHHIRAAVVDGVPYLSIGALATLTAVCEHGGAGALAGGLLVQAAQGEGPVNLRNQATVGGVTVSPAVLLDEAVETGAIARVARTPADRPIVAAVAVRHGATTRVALCGVAARPVLDGAPLDPPDDYKGSAAYRRSMVTVLTERALAMLA